METERLDALCTVRAYTQALEGHTLTWIEDG